MVQENLPGRPGDVLAQSVHQRADQSLPIGGDEVHQDDVPGDVLQTGGSAGLSADLRVMLDHPQCDSAEGLQHLQHLKLVMFSV